MNRKLDSIEEGINEKVDTIMLTQGGQAGFSKMKNSNQQRMFQQRVMAARYGIRESQNSIAYRGKGSMQKTLPAIQHEKVLNMKEKYSKERHAELFNEPILLPAAQNL